MSQRLPAIRRNPAELMFLTLANLAVACLAALLLVTTANAVVLNIDPVTGKLLGASDIPVQSIEHDVPFLGIFTVEFIDGTCIEVFTGCDDADDFDFNAQIDALNATLALDLVLIGIFDDNPGLIQGCDVPRLCGIHTPYRIDFDDPSIVGHLTFFNQGTQGESDSISGLGTGIDFDTTGNDLQVWARWTRQVVEVTEPGILGMLAAGALAIGLVRRRPRSTDRGSPKEHWTES